MFVFTITGYLHEDVISGLFNQFIRLFGRQRTKPRVAGFRRLIMGEPKRFGTMFGEELSLTCQSRRNWGPVSRDEGARSARGWIAAKRGPGGRLFPRWLEERRRGD